MRAPLFSNSLKLVNLELPVQADPSKYIGLIKEKIAEERILRWYISSIENGKCALDIVIFEQARPKLGG